MKFKKLCIILLLLIFSISVVSATEVNNTIEIDNPLEVTPDNEFNYTFTDLSNEIDESEDILNIQHDYTYNNESDNGYVVIEKDNFIINGNNHILDGNKQSGIFNITGTNVTIKNLVFTNGKTDIGGIVYSTGEVTLSNVTFISNNVTYISDHTEYRGGAISNKGGTINCYDSKFIDNHAESGSAIFIENGQLNIKNTYITSSVSNRYGQIWARYSEVNIENVDFINISAIYSPAIALEYCDDTIITNSRFINLTADISAGAICLKRSGNLSIKGCEFINTKSSKNAGAVNIDYLFDGYSVTILDTLFYNASSMIGGAYIQLGGYLLLNNTSFINNKATYSGGAVYLSFTGSIIDNSTFSSNSVELLDDYPTYGGAIYSDFNNLIISNSRFINNTAYNGNAIYGRDTGYYSITYSTFENNTNAIFTHFDKNPGILDNNEYNNDSVITDQTYSYETFVETSSLEFKLINNTINVNSLPTRFDSRDWGWTSAIKHQGHMGACWTFATLNNLESAILKACGIEYDFSENHLLHSMIRYSPYGTISDSEGGEAVTGASYLLAWFGPILEEEDNYDEVGKLSPFLTENNIIHIQDVIYIPNDEIPNGSKIKSAILNYGSVNGNYYAEYGTEGYYNPKTSSQYTNESITSNHEILVIGWDDNYSANNFLITPPGDGAWIIKNSWGPDFGDNGILYLSYYDKTFVATPNLIDFSMGIIIENTIHYNKNYQHDFAWEGNFADSSMFGEDNGTITYSNQYEATDDDLIAAVGTYFNQSGINYTVEIYVNNQLKLTQDGISPYCGFHTIKLNEYIPIKKGDLFKARITSNAMPYVICQVSRVHYSGNESFYYHNGEWIDLYTSNLMIACLKVYTIDNLPIMTEDLVKIYKNDSQFEANIGVANEKVTFEINGMNYTRTSNENGTAIMALNLVPGNYTIKTTYTGTTVENTITVLPTLIAENLVKYYRNASQFFITLIDGEGNPVSGVNITMNINGVFYDRLTNENGTAKLNINLEPGEYILTAIDPLTGLMMSYNITVLPVLSAENMEMKYLDGSTFNATVLDGEGNPLANASVTFNINGVFYTRTTDSNGIARLNIRLMAGEYIITSEYDGMAIANTITIKD